MEANLKVTKGEVIVFTEGQYSDFGLDAFLVFIKDCNLAEKAQHYFNGKDRYGDEDMSNFSALLIADEYAVPVRYRELHLGSYSDFNADFGVKWSES